MLCKIILQEFDVPAEEVLGQSSNVRITKMWMKDSVALLQFKFQPLGRMLNKDYQLDASQGYLLRPCLKIKIHRDVAHECTVFLPITNSWAKPKVTHTHTHTHTQTALT
jgi:hypothetical protein